MNKLLIVHGYSDKSGSFTELANLLRKEELYSDIRYIDYDSIDDQATFQDYADRLMISTTTSTTKNMPTISASIFCATAPVAWWCGPGWLYGGSGS
jgi:hypothetical protein